MKLRPPISNRWTRSRQAGFTMLEIAISLGVIAFALIAIIGILPTGLQTQRDNREETLVNQDARLLIETIRRGGQDSFSDLGSFVANTDGLAVAGIPTRDLIRLLTDTNRAHEIMMKSISGAVVDRSNKDFGFTYQVRSEVTTNLYEFYDTRLSNQVHEVRLRFAWPVSDKNVVNNEANRYVVRTMVSGLMFSNLFYAQEYFQPTNFP